MSSPAPTTPRLPRRRALGGASARSLLLTVLGEFVLPHGAPVWTATLLDLLGTVGVEPKAVRQALARTADDGWVEPTRSGRRTAWSLTSHGAHMLRDGAARIYGFAEPPLPWDGRWLVVLVSVPESDRRLRHRLRTRLAWQGLGALSSGTWVSPHPEREPEVAEVLTSLGLGDLATVFVGSLGRLGSAERVARTAWDLDDLAERYVAFVDGFRSVVVSDARSGAAWQIRLVQEWRRFPFLDPTLPAELLPADWVGAEAARLFADRHAAWKPLADAYWRSLVEQAG